MYVPCRPLCIYADLCAKVLPLPSVYRQNSLAGQIAFEHIFFLCENYKSGNLKPTKIFWVKKYNWVVKMNLDILLHMYVFENPHLNFAYYISTDGIFETGAYGVPSKSQNPTILGSR